MFGGEDVGLGRALAGGSSDLSLLQSRPASGGHLAPGQVPHNYLFNHDAGQHANMTVDTVNDNTTTTTTTTTTTNNIIPERMAADIPPQPSSSDYDPETMQPHPAPYVDRPEDITVAIEIKYLIPFLALGALDPIPDDPRPIHQAPIPASESALSRLANVLIADVIRSVDGEDAVTGEDIKAAGKQEREFWDSRWIVKKSGSPEPREDELKIKEYVWVAVEVVGHKYLYKDPQTRSRIANVLEKVHASFRFVSNYTCDTHVHLGRQDDRAFTLDTLQRMATLCWPAEQTLRSVRNPKSKNYHNIWTWGFETRHSRLGLSVSKLYGPAADLVLTQDGLGIPDEQTVRAIAAQSSIPARELKVIQEIWKSNSHRKLGKLLSGKFRRYRRLGLNFSMFGLEDNRSRANPRTMEFRFMEGTLDAELATNWALICAKVAEVAILRGDDRYEMTLCRALQTLDSGAHDLPTGEERGSQIGREFRELMESLGVPRDIYAPFEEKVIRENYWQPDERPVDSWGHIGWECAENDSEEDERVSPDVPDPPNTSSPAATLCAVQVQQNAASIPRGAPPRQTIKVR